MGRLTLYRRGSDTGELEDELNRRYHAVQGRHYRVEDWPEEYLNLEPGIPVLGVYVESIDEEIHHAGEDTISSAFGSLKLEDLEEELES